MPDIEFTKEEKDIITRKIQLYFTEELDLEIGQFDAQFLLDFFSEEIGPYFYNRGLYDSQTILQSKIESIADAIYELEKITEFRR